MIRSFCDLINKSVNNYDPGFKYQVYSGSFDLINKSVNNYDQVLL